MTRADAFALASDLADGGYSCTVSLSVYEKHMPREHCSVGVHALRFEAVALQALITIGERHDVGLHLLGDRLRFVEDARNRTAAS